MVIEKRKLMILNDLIGKKLFLIEKQRYHTRYVLFMIRNHKLPYKGEDIFQKWIWRLLGTFKFKPAKIIKVGMVLSELYIQHILTGDIDLLYPTVLIGVTPMLHYRLNSKGTSYFYIYIFSFNSTYLWIGAVNLFLKRIKKIT